jgi:hypothetical protein
MNYDCDIRDDLVCALCGKPASGKRVRRNCPAKPIPQDVISQAEEEAKQQADGRPQQATAPGFVTPPPVPPQPPALARETDTVSWLTKARNFAKATAQHIAAGMPTASDEEILRRWNICQGCEYLQNDACSQCGCPVARDRKFVSKLAWADQSCPVGKWGPVANANASE